MTTTSSTKKGTWGGARIGTGRKKSQRRGCVPHRARPALSPRHPVHVVLRVKSGVGRLRRGRMYRLIRRLLGHYLGRPEFRIVHVSIQSNHIHLIVEAANKRALTRGMQSFAIRCARAIQSETRYADKVFEARYHATQIITPRQARNALAYVLNNWRRHREDLFNTTTMKASIDPYSSGISFKGWARAPRFEIPAGYVPLPVSTPMTRLLTSEWKRFGEIGLFECPGPMQ
ncbi:MAG: transposase [Kofleriaceae bacterium]